MSRKVLNGLDLQNQRIQNVASGSQPADAINLAQLQAALAGLSWHGAVRAASTTNITVATPGATIDGVTLAVGDRVLLKNQTTASQNNIYVFQGASTAMTLAVDGQQGNINAGAATYVDEGTVNADTAWTLATDGTITVGTTALTWNKFGASVAYTAGAGLALAGTQFSIDTTLIPRKVATNVGDGSSTSIAFPHNLATLDVQVQVYEIATGATVECDQVRTNANTVTLGFAVPPNAAQYRASVQG